MTTSQIALVVALAIVAGVLGWRSTRRRRRSIFEDRPHGVSDAQHQRRLGRRRSMRRIALTVLYACLGAVAGWTLGLMPMFG